MNRHEIFNELLEKGGKTQTEIAAEYGTTRQHIQKIKSGLQNLPLEKLHKIADILGLKILIKIIKK